MSNALLFSLLTQVEVDFEDLVIGVAFDILCHWEYMKVIIICLSLAKNDLWT